MAKSFGVSFDYVLYDLSYYNMLMYGFATPSYSGKKEKEEEQWDDSIDANNPANFNDTIEEED